MFGFKGAMFSEKTKNLVILSKLLMLYGYKVLVLSPGVDVRAKEETKRSLSRLDNVHSGVGIPSTIGWRLEDGNCFRLVDEKYIVMRSCTPSDKIADKNVIADENVVTIDYNFVKSRSQDRVLSLSVSKITPAFLKLIFDPEYTPLKGEGNLPYVPDVIVLDECQFLSELEMDAFSKVFSKYRKHTIVGGLISDFKQDAWGGYHKLTVHMDFDFLVKSKCIDCNKKNAIYTRKYGSESSLAHSNGADHAMNAFNEEVVQIGDNDVYYAICQKCLWIETDKKKQSEMADWKKLLQDNVVQTDPRDHK